MGRVLKKVRQQGFDRQEVSRDGAQALAFDKKIYASKAESGPTSASRYELRVKFEDGCGPASRPSCGAAEITGPLLLN